MLCLGGRIKYSEGKGDILAEIAWRFEETILCQNAMHVCKPDLKNHFFQIPFFLRLPGKWLFLPTHLPLLSC